MQCQEVKRRLNNGRYDDLKVREHLKGCAACAREATAARLLGESMTTVREHADTPATPLAFVRTRIESRAASSQKQENSVMARITRTFARYPKVTVTFVAAVAVFAAVALIPFSYSTINGYSATFTLPDNNLGAPPETLESGLAAIGYPNADVNIHMDAGKLEVVFSNLPTYQAAHDAEAMFQHLSRLELEAEIAPIRSQESGSLYAQATDKLKEVRITRDDRSANEIADRIVAALAEHGISADVNVFYGIDGKMQIDVSMEGTGDGTTGIFVGEDGDVQVLENNDGEWTTEDGRKVKMEQTDQ